MSSLFRAARKGHRKRGKRDRRLSDLAQAGIQLLAVRDYEAISMARIARLAGCSVGSMYSRFPNKHAYLDYVVAAIYRTMSARTTTRLDTEGTQPNAVAALVKDIVEFVVTDMTSDKSIGAIRATMKLATVRSNAIEPFEAYRDDITKWATAALSARLGREAKSAVPIAMQIVLATVTDAILQPRPGPMAAGSRRMQDALIRMMLGYLGISGTGKTGSEAKGEVAASNVKFDGMPKAQAAVVERKPANRANKSQKVGNAKTKTNDGKSGATKAISPESTVSDKPTQKHRSH